MDSLLDRRAAGLLVTVNDIGLLSEVRPMDKEEIHDVFVAGIWVSRASISVFLIELSGSGDFSLVNELDSARSLPKKFWAPFDPVLIDSPLDKRGRRDRGSVDEEFTASPERPDEDTDDAVEYDLWSSGMRSELLGSMMPIGEKMSSKGAIRPCRESMYVRLQDKASKNNMIIDYATWVIMTWTILCWLGSKSLSILTCESLVFYWCMQKNACGERGVWNLDMSHFCGENYGFIRCLIKEIYSIWF